MIFIHFKWAFVQSRERERERLYIWDCLKSSQKQARKSHSRPPFSSSGTMLSGKQLMQRSWGHLYTLQIWYILLQSLHWSLLCFWSACLQYRHLLAACRGLRWDGGFPCCLLDPAALLVSICSCDRDFFVAQWLVVSIRSRKVLVQTLRTQSSTNSNLRRYVIDDKQKCMNSICGVGLLFLDCGELGRNDDLLSIDQLRMIIKSKMKWIRTWQL